MKRSRYIIFAVVFVASLLPHFASIAQIGQQEYSKSELFNDANLLMDDKLYVLALPIWKKLLKDDKDNANINYKVGLCYYNKRTHREESLKYFKKAVENTTKNYDLLSSNERKAPMDAHYYMGEAEHLNYKFEKAKEYYNLFLKKAHKKHQLRENAERGIQQCDWAKEMVANPRNINVINLGPGVNSEFDEHSPVLSLDESVIYFTTRKLRKDSSNKGFIVPEDGGYFEDIYVSYHNEDGTFGEATPVTFTRPNEHEATVGLSADGQRLYIYEDDEGDGNIYVSELFGERWSRPQLLEGDINTKSTETHITFTPDNRTLYFVSNRKGGQGGKDIYRSIQLPNGEWSLAQNMGPTINTPLDEEGPYIHPDGKTLYFSSQGHKSMGGFDIFFTELNEDNTWSTPKNIGYPINSVDDDVFYQASPDGKRAYYSSAADGGYGEHDIYLIEQNDAVEAALTLVKGYIQVPKNQKLPEDTRIIMTDNETGDFIAESRPLQRTGSFVFIIPPGKNYNLSYESKGTSFYNENIYVPLGTTYNEVEKEITMNPLKLGTGEDNVVVVNQPTVKNKPRWQLRYMAMAKKIPQGLIVKYIDETGKVLYEETADEDGYFKYHSLGGGMPFIFSLDAQNSSQCSLLEIVLVGKADVGYKLREDSDCIFKATEIKPAFKFASLSKEPPADLEVLFLDNDNNIVLMEKVDSTGHFMYHTLPGEKQYNLQLKSNYQPYCAEKELTVVNEKTGAKYEYKLNNDCVAEHIAPAPRFKFTSLSTIPAGLSVLFIDDDGKIAFEEPVDKEGAFSYHMLSDERHYLLKLKSTDSNPCESESFTIEGSGRKFVFALDDNCTFIKQKNLFRFTSLGGPIPAGLKVRYLDDNGNVLYEEKVSDKGYFAFRELKKGQTYNIELVTDDPDLCQSLSLGVPGKEDIKMAYIAGMGCIFGQTTQQTKVLFVEKMGYNKNGIAPDGIEYKQFAQKIGEIITEKGVVNISIESSASRVPTKSFTSNLDLSKLRAKKAKDILLRTIRKLGIDESKIVWANTSTLVQGPKYANDAGNHKKYEPFQYVKMWAN